MPRRPAPAPRLQAPSSPRRRWSGSADDFKVRLADVRSSIGTRELHPLTDATANAALHAYDTRVKEAFDRLVPVLRRLSALQHEEGFEAKAQELARAELGFSLPPHLRETAWVTQLDMRTLFAWCLFETYEQISASFFDDDPLGGRPGGAATEAFDAFLLECGFHLLDITPCADGRLAHAVASALRIPFSSVRRRPHAGALFDVENTVNRWVKTEHRRYREGLPNPAHADTRYLKVVLYHFSSRDPSHAGCAAHGSHDDLAARSGRQRLLDFQTAIENSFCCGASVDLLLLGLDTDTDALRVHVPGRDGDTDLEHWLDGREVHEATRQLSAAEACQRISGLVQQ
ncbi:MAG: carboxysome shell carbonic anhydrase, partial [Cyanobacteriota bacterium]